MFFYPVVSSLHFAGYEVNGNALTFAESKIFLQIIKFINTISTSLFNSLMVIQIMFVWSMECISIMTQVY